MNAVASIYAAAGSPRYALHNTPGHCRSCGARGQGQAFNRWVKPTFTDWDKIQPGEIVCTACLFCFSDSNDHLAARVGKDKPQRFRNYSHFVSGGEWIPLGKGEKRRIGELLIAGSDVAIVAMSGQKHLAFRCPLGWWQIEEHTVVPFSRELEMDLAHCGELYRGGITKSEIETGRYSLARVETFGVQRWRTIENQIAPLRGSMRLQLAVFLVQHGEDNGS